jgi:precorrin-6Y C5,15-methyltransferase (decarboxylating)
MLCMADSPNRESTTSATPNRWLSIIGIGEDGVAGLSELAKSHIVSADIVFGGKRHLRLAADIIAGTAMPWPTPFDPDMTAVTAHRGQAVCVLASGDPFLFGVGATLARHVPRAEMHVIPAPSAFSLAASRMGWALADVETISLHGRPRDVIRPLLHPRTRIIALTSDGDDPAHIAQLLNAAGFGASTLTVLETMGGPRERSRTASAEAFDLTGIDALNVLAIDVRSTDDARIIPLATGRKDSLFKHDGQITKQAVRAVTLSQLAPQRGEYLWDIGAGSGSIGIEWMLAHPRMRASAIEPRADRIEAITHNAIIMGVPGLDIVHGGAPEALSALAPPDAIFIGGGATAPGLIDTAMAALHSGGRMVINAVTLETEAVLLSLHANMGGNLIRLSVAMADPVGRMTGWRPAMPVTIWAWVKP